MRLPDLSYRGVFRLAWPLALGMVNNAAMQFADRAFLARESMASLEAVLPASLLVSIVVVFFQAVVACSGTFVAQFQGAGDARGGVRSYCAGVWIAVLSGVLSLAALPLGEWVFALTAHGAEVVVRERAYYGICIVGTFFLYGQMAAQSYFTGIGRTRLVLAVNVLGNALNVAMDPLLIFGWCGLPALGIAGAAYATVFSTMVQWMVLAFAAHCAVCGRAGRGAWRPDAELLRLVRRILRFGIPSGAQSVLNLLSFAVFVFVTGRAGDTAFAVSNACFSVCWLLCAPMEGFAVGAATLVGQSQGADDSDAAFRAGCRTTLLAVSLVVVAAAGVLIFRRPILSLFAPADPAQAAEFLSLGSVLFVLMASWQVFDATDVVVSGALKGAGDTRFVFWWMLVCAFAFWLPLVFVVARFNGTMPALWGTMVAYVVVICAGTLVRWFRGGWRRIRLVDEKVKFPIDRGERF